MPRSRKRAKGAGDDTTVRGDGGAVSAGVSHEPAESETSGLRDSGMERLRRPADQGVQPTNRTLATALQTLASTSRA